jgi:hypothetical protein
MAASVLLLGICAAAVTAQAPDQILWTFDRLDPIGGVKTTVEGEPRIVETPLGQAIEFDGVDDAVWIEKHPLAGAKTFTFEAIFRPDGGAFEQRWFHLAARDPATGLLASADHPTTGQDANARFLFEIRVVGANWYLDAFVNGPGYNRALMFKDKLHPMGRWYHVAQTKDGTTIRSNVNGALQGEAAIAFTPLGEGAASIGTRINRRNYFRGAVRQARFSTRALAPEAFLKVP